MAQSPSRLLFRSPAECLAVYRRPRNYWATRNLSDGAPARGPKSAGLSFQSFLPGRNSYCGECGSLSSLCHLAVCTCTACARADAADARPEGQIAQVIKAIACPLRQTVGGREVKAQDAFGLKRGCRLGDFHQFEAEIGSVELRHALLQSQRRRTDWPVTTLRLNRRQNHKQAHDAKPGK